jgi:type III secretion protein L
MAVWFKYGSSTVGVEDGFIRAADFAALISLQQAAEAVQIDRLKTLSEAQAQADRCISDAQLKSLALLDDAQQQSDLLIAQAQEQYTAGYDQGFSKGHEDATTQWTERALANAHSSQRALQRQRERLSGVVSLAVETMVEEEDKQAIFRRALRTVSKLVRDVPLLTLRVHFDDKDAAQRAITDMVDQLQVNIPIEVVADAASADGCCTFESDQGVIDASLGTQLAAIKRAVARAAKTASLFSEVDAEQAPKTAAVGLSKAGEEKLSVDSAVSVQPQAIVSNEQSSLAVQSNDVSVAPDMLDEDNDDQLVDELPLADGFEYEDSSDDELIDDAHSFGGIQSDTAIRLSNPS